MEGASLTKERNVLLELFVGTRADGVTKSGLRIVKRNQSGI